MSRTHKLLVVVAIFTLAGLVASWLEADWSGVFWAVLAAVGCVQTVVLGLGLAPSALGCTSVLQSIFWTLGASSWAVRDIYRSALPESASVVLAVGGFLMLASALFMGRRGSTRVSTEAGVSTQGS